MTPADRTQHPVVGRGMSQAGEVPPVPPASPLHIPPGCAECARLGDQIRAAFLSGDLSRETDIRVMRARHLKNTAPGAEVAA